MNRSILMVTFDYPPVQSSSGLLRMLAFSRDLAEFGWDVTVLTAGIVANRAEFDENDELIPSNVKVIRTKALDAACHLSVFERYPSVLEWPDRYSSWIITATLAGLFHLRKKRTDVLFSSYPIASAHLVGYLLAKFSGIPWVADFRDPMLMADHPGTKSRRRAHAWVEAKAVTQSRACLFTNARSLQHHADKYPEVSRNKFHVVENGYEETLFANAEKELQRHPRPPTGQRVLKILHSGTLYPDHRDPSALFVAIKELSKEWTDNEIKVRFILRASGYHGKYQDLANDNGIAPLIEFAPSIPYRESIKELLTSDGLLLIQGRSCNQQIPAKLYEYLRAGNPILALADKHGATAEVLRAAGVTVNASNTAAEEIKRELRIFIASLWNTQNNRKITNNVVQYSRRLRSEQLDHILSSCCFD